MRTFGALVSILLVVAGTSLRAGTVTLDFEGFSDSTILTNQYSGLGATFSNTIIFTAGISLNEFELPPQSGVNVAFDNNGPISISFTNPVLSFGGFFTYAVPLTLAAFDATSTQVGSAMSAFNSNLALSGDAGSSPNEFLQVSSAGGISSVTITGDPGGGSFAMDDATFSTAGSSTVPEPNTLGLIFLGSMIFIGFRRRLK